MSIISQPELFPLYWKAVFLLIAKKKYLPKRNIGDLIGEGMVGAALSLEIWPLTVWKSRGNRALD